MEASLKPKGKMAEMNKTSNKKDMFCAQLVVNL